MPWLHYIIVLSCDELAAFSGRAEEKKHFANKNPHAGLSDVGGVCWSLTEMAFAVSPITYRCQQLAG